jgi:hypothetical protein
MARDATVFTAEMVAACAVVTVAGPFGRHSTAQKGGGKFPSVAGARCFGIIPL